MVSSLLLLAALSASELLERSIRHHDPDGHFARSAIAIELSETRRDGSVRETHVLIDNADGRFEMERRDNLGSSSRFVIVNDALVESEPDIAPDRARTTRNYYVYLYGLPMKLLDPGTRLDPDAKKTSFMGRDALELRVTYDESVGSDTWYFYLDPSTYALIGYRFYHDEAANDGEYIILEGEAHNQGLRLPRTRKWYRHQDESYLGTDTIESIRIR